jgi:uncharacterized protein
MMRTRFWLPDHMTARSSTRALAGLIVVAAVVVTNLPAAPPKIITIRAPAGSIDVEVADSPALRARGLSWRTTPPGGLLLVWSDSGPHPVWMREMEFALDLIWCDSEGRVLAIKPAVPPCPTAAPCPIYGAMIPDPKFVLELRSGHAQRLRIVVGTSLDIPLPTGGLSTSAH